MQNKLKLSSKDIESCHDYAKSVVQDVNDVIDSKSSVSIERTILRVLGVDGVNEFDAPLPNILIDHIVENGGIEKGVSYWCNGYWFLS